MAGQKVLQFPIRHPHLFSSEINCQVLSTGELRRLLYAAIRALPHVEDKHRREDLRRALCDLILSDEEALA